MILYIYSNSFSRKPKIDTKCCHLLAITLGGGGGVSESTDRQGCAILALEVVLKNLIFA